MKTSFQLLMISGMLLGGCSVANLPTDDSMQMYPPSNYEIIQVYSTDQAGRPYAIIGYVTASAEAFGDGSASVKYLKKEAAKLGADGIINLRLEIADGILGNSVTASGTAVRFIN